MAADPRIVKQIDQLIDLFNRRSLDLPDGVFTRQTQFLVNGVSFEEMLGRSPADALVLMLARGAAGYRFASKAVQHAMPDARLQRGEFDETAKDEGRVVSGQCWLSGHLRGTGESSEILIDVTLWFRASAAQRVSAALDPAALAKLQEARLRA
jgi:hypothetical protein